MKKGIVIVRSLTGKRSKDIYTEYQSVTSEDVINFDELVEKRFIKEIKSYAEVLKLQQEIGFKVKVRNIWKEASKVEIEKLVKSNSKEELQQILEDKGFAEPILNDWNKEELATKILTI